ncbi:hypothetical protein [Pantoea allii]|uniref:hypothetical protein n=1 Tax=Pantoea allii TaxID=574096 RepID=UPI0024B698D4|nr:hypothetical protein [Pantoea allii]MDJ0087707.1 hypothetical protein [Pantoea allii]
MADEQKPLLNQGGRMPFRYSLGRLYSEFSAILQKQQSRQLQFKTNDANILYWKWSDETSWKEVAEMSNASPATSISAVSGLQQALDSKMDDGVITVSDIEGLSAAMQNLADWGSIKGKPETFPPSSHKHDIADVNGLRTELDGKVNDGEVSVDSVTGLPEKLESLANTQWSEVSGKPNSFPPSAHKHAVADVEGLSESLTSLSKPAWDSVSGKPSSFNPSSHKHGITDVTGLQAALDAKRNGGTIATSDVTGLEEQLKRIGASPAWGDVTGKPESYPPSSHTHAVADVTGLASALSAIPKTEIVTGKVVTAGVKVAVKFAKTYTNPPVVQPSSTWAGQQVVVGEATDITTTGCNVTVMQSKGTLLLTAGPFEPAAAGSSFKMLVIGN